MTDHFQDIIPRLRLSGLLAKLSAEELRDLSTYCRRISYIDSRPVITNGESGEFLYLVTAGFVVIYLNADRTIDAIARIAGAGETFGEWCLCDVGLNQVTVDAFGDCDLICIPRAPLIDLLQHQPELVVSMLFEISVRLKTLVHNIIDLKMKSASQRLATYFAALSATTSGSAEITLPFEKKLLARQLGMQPETLSRSLMKLQSIGVQFCRSDNMFHVQDIERLRRVANQGYDDGSDEDV